MYMIIYKHACTDMGVCVCIMFSFACARVFIGRSAGPGAPSVFELHQCRNRARALRPIHP